MSDVDLEEQVLEASKQAAAAMIYGLLAHFIDCHTTSEREQELLSGYVNALAKAITTMEIVDE